MGFIYFQQYVSFFEFQVYIEGDEVVRLGERVDCHSFNIGGF